LKKAKIPIIANYNHESRSVVSTFQLLMK